MENNRCGCGKEVTHKCVFCPKQALLCLDCIAGHLARNPQDSIIPIRVENNDNRKICEVCNENPASKLQVLTSNTISLCKKCKKAVSSGPPSIFVPIKWKEIVSCSQDINEVYVRTHAQKQANDEVEKSYSIDAYEKSIFSLRDTIIAFAQHFAEKTMKEASSLASTSSETIRNIKNEIEIQSLKKLPDVNTIGGKLVASLLNQGVPCTLPTFNYTQFNQEEVSDCIEKLFDRAKISTTTSNYNVYLFTPGKQNLIKIDIEKMVRKEYVFERNWTFEASWCELESKDIFFCGGNGISNSEVLLIDVHNKSITQKKSFVGRSGHSMIEKNGHIFVFGGNKGNIAERYRFNTDDWEQLADLPYRISRISICEIPNGIFMAGIDCGNSYIYNLPLNTYTDLGGNLDVYRNKNKIVFSHEDTIYIMCGDKLFHCSLQNIGQWSQVEISDRDWWSYSKPVIYKNCAYFIKYFVRNLWQLDLKTFTLQERVLGDIPLAS
ncbi:hypothetical protein SteCoe_3165 [Stentor coeruleus]|uniref:Uncharacterized protein n=1 Tax=Stentor coeruleus TaxID=5963 RepID=A0A1R2CXU6_9CILI|nr:hypothetical protein SteCoe_3165 [Stentor coeruleus]